MSFGAIRRTAEDRRWSKAIKERDQFTCQRCLRRHVRGSHGLHAAHHFTRKIKATRFDLDNGMALCFGCHQFFDSHPEDKEAFWRSKIGNERFDALRLRAHGGARA